METTDIWRLGGEWMTVGGSGQVLKACRHAPALALRSTRCPAAWTLYPRQVCNQSKKNITLEISKAKIHHLCHWPLPHWPPQCGEQLHGETCWLTRSWRQILGEGLAHPHMRGWPLVARPLKSEQVFLYVSHPKLKKKTRKISLHNSFFNNKSYSSFIFREALIQPKVSRQDLRPLPNKRRAARVPIYSFEFK